MSPSFFLKLPSSLCIGRKNTEQRGLVPESGDQGCRPAPVSDELGNNLPFLWPHPFPKRKNQDPDTYVSYFTGRTWGLDEKLL